MICLFCRNEIEGRGTKYCSNLCQQTFQRFRKVLKGVANNRSLKIYLLAIRGKRCAVCKFSEWMGKPIPLELDHINGNSDDNTYDNIRLICCNCHALTPTFKAKNRGKGRHYRRERYAAGKSY